MKRSILLSRVVCVLFGCLILALGVLTFALPREDYSEGENRYLAALPTPTAEGLFSGELSRDVASFSRDHVPARGMLLDIKSMGEYLLLRGENNHVLFGKDGYLIKRLEWQPTHAFSQSLSGVRVLETMFAERGIPTLTVFAPRAIDVLTEKLPPLYPKNGAEDLENYLENHAEGILFPRALLAEKASAGEPVFFRTDHHWTPLGAYYLYEAMGDALGYTPYPLSEFREETVATDFLGTSASAALFPLAEGETVTRVRYDGDETLTVTDMTTGEHKQGLYRDEYLQKKDKYASFLGGNFAHLRITGEGDRPRLLLIKDSYANCLVPFLARHFDIDLVDLRYVRGDARAQLAALLDSADFDCSLLLFNIETLSTDAGLAPFAKNP